MNKKEFGEEIRAYVENHVQESYEVKLQEVRKNNNVVLLGVMVNDKVNHVAPTLYLDGFFEEYLGGRPMQEIAEIVTESLTLGMPKQRIDFSFFSNYDAIKDQICYKLIHAEKNAILLKDIPHLPLLDLAICFFCPMKQEEIGEGSILIRNEHLKKWNVSVLELWNRANENTRRLYPEQSFSMEETYREMEAKLQKSDPERQEKTEEKPVFPNVRILTNERKAFGAAVILYDGYLESLAEELQGDFYVIPSSIHEVIILPAFRKEDAGILEEIICEVNATCVDLQEVLSDRLYLFDGSQRRLKFANEETEQET